MRIRSFQDFAETISYSFKLMRGDLRSADGIRLFLSVTEGLQLSRDEAGWVWLVNVNDDDKTLLGSFDQGQPVLDLMENVAEFRRELLASRHDSDEADFDDEYEGSPVARSKVFRTNLIIKAINSMAERVATGFDDPEHGIRIVEK